MAYTIHYAGESAITGEPYCFECGEIIAYGKVGDVSVGKSLYWNEDNSKTRVHLLNTGYNEFDCTRCKKHFPKFSHVTVIAEEFS